MLDSPGFAVFANVSSKLGLWLITREKNQLPLGDGSWLKKGGYKKEGDKQFLRHCEFLNRIYEFSVFTMAVYGKNLGKTKTENIFSLGLAKIFTVNCHGENAEFVDAIQKFAVA